jgi:hypothetical protein
MNSVALRRKEEVICDVVSELNKGCVYSTREEAKLFNICKPNLLQGISHAVTPRELHGINATNVKYLSHLHMFLSDISITTVAVYICIPYTSSIIQSM